ncbi:allatostatin-A receptor-like [Pocillopora verrucosa]|uniref:allatostatin-A receptor-like n=1 Tax=Pocillopora verrucosa TaxID=203993 RepID=UPI003340A3AC
MMTFYTQSLSAQVAITTVFSILVLISVVGNILACIVILANRSMRTPMNYLILNLALADIMVVSFVTPRFIFIHAFDHPDGLLGTLICKLFTGSNFSWLGGSASVYSLVAISVERYFAVVHPYGNRGKLTMKRVKYVIAGCWVLAVAFNLPLFFTMQYNPEIDFCTEYWPAMWMARVYSTSWLIFFGALPIALMTVLYARVVRRLWFKRDQGSRVTQAAVLKSRKRVTKMVITVSLVYSVTWFPVLIIYMLNYFHDSQQYGNIVYIIGIVIVTFNSCVNPFVYVFVNERFRNHLKRLFRLPCQGANRMNLERGEPTNDGADSSSQHHRPAIYVVAQELACVICDCCRALLITIFAEMPPHTASRRETITFRWKAKNDDLRSPMGLNNIVIIG